MCVAFCVCSLFATANAETVSKEYENMKYEIVDGEISIVGPNGNIEDLNIPDKIEEIPD